MGFIVDKVSEDSFYENLLLGLSRVLEKSPCVSKLSLKRFSGIKQADLRAWEHNNGVILPEDLRSFYASTNGFLFTYEFSYDYNSNEEDRDVKLGIIQVNPLNDLARIFGYETKNSGQVNNVGKTCTLSLSRDSKVFELVSVDETSKVVLAYPTTYSAPTIWLYTSQMHFSYLAEDFTTYFRMCLAHLGIPRWQYVFSKDPVPEWGREMFNLLAPGVLIDDRNLIDSHTYKYSIEHTNKIDPNIFGTGQNLTVDPKKKEEFKGRDKQQKRISERPVRRAASCKSKKCY